MGTTAYSINKQYTDEDLTGVLLNYSEREENGDSITATVTLNKNNAKTDLDTLTDQELVNIGRSIMVSRIQPSQKNV